jgi:NAD(P)-dependent dehydrogenase (short-subunit alcohol dehydrogenase family)
MTAINLEGKVALVTGAAGAIGEAVARAYAEAGARVVCASRKDTSGLVEELRAKGAEATALTFDLAHQGDAERMVAETVATYGRLDVLANIAGMGGTGFYLLDQGQEWWDQILLVNLTGTMWMCKAALPQMIQQGRGSIINTSSVTGQSGQAGSTAYAAAKAGIMGFSKALAKEVAQHRINVNVVAPGLIDSAMSRARGNWDRWKEWVLWPRPGVAEDCAGLYLLLASDASEFITGQIVSPNGGGFI